jgi:hypothetical protein
MHTWDDRQGRGHAYFLALAGAFAFTGSGFLAAGFATGAAFAGAALTGAGFFSGALGFGTALATGFAGAFAFAATVLTTFAGAFTASNVFFFAFSAAAFPFAKGILQQRMSAIPRPISSTVTIRPQTSQLNKSPFLAFAMVVPPCYLKLSPIKRLTHLLSHIILQEKNRVIKQLSLFFWFQRQLFFSLNPTSVDDK